MLLHITILRSSPGTTYCSLLKLYVKRISTLLYVSVMQHHILYMCICCIPCREVGQRFGTNNRSHLQWSRIQKRIRLLTLEILAPWRWDRQVFPKRRQESTTTRCVITQKSAFLVDVTFLSTLIFLVTVWICVQLPFADKQALKVLFFLLHLTFWRVIILDFKASLRSARYTHVSTCIFSVT